MLTRLVPFAALVVAASCACFDNGDKEIGGNCFSFVNQKLSYNDARNWCHYKNPVTASFLASVPNQFTDNFLASYARSAFGTNDGYFWVGLSREKSYTPWTWDTGYTATWTNFENGQLGQNYAAESIVNGKWQTFGEGEKMAFVCMYDPSAPPTFAPPATGPTAAPTTVTPTPFVPTTTEDYDEFCNIGEKHSTFLLAYSTGFDPATFRYARNFFGELISENRHNYTKLATVRFDALPTENITYYDDLSTFLSVLDANPPNGTWPRDPSLGSDVLSVVSSFLAASGRPLESSMVVLLVSRLPEVGVDLTAEEYDVITNNNVKIFPLMAAEYYYQEFPKPSRSYQALETLAANSNGHFLVGETETIVERMMSTVFNVTYTDSLAFTRNIGGDLAMTDWLKLGTLKVPRSRTGYVNFKLTVTANVNDVHVTYVPDFNLVFSQANMLNQTLKLSPDVNSNLFHYYDVQLKANTDCQILFEMHWKQTFADFSIRLWTDSAVYHYGSFAAIDDPMGGTALTKVDEYGGAALRMRLMNDCYSDYAGSIIITDCNGVVSAKYDSVQDIPTQYIFVDEGSFPHYPFVPFFCDSQPKNHTQCITGSASKYDVQFVAGEFTVVRSFQCRPGVGQIAAGCGNVDANGNYYCTRNAVPYKRGPTGQLTDCMGHGHLEFDFDDTQSYVCVCDNGYSGDSCEKRS